MEDEGEISVFDIEIQDNVEHIDCQWLYQKDQRMGVLVVCGKISLVGSEIMTLSAQSFLSGSNFKMISILRIPILLIGIAALMIGCGPYEQASLPTTTPAPVLAASTVTATFVPPPTVTVYPTATPRTGGSGIVVVTATAVGTAVSNGLPSPTQSLVTQTQPSAGVDPPTAVPVASSSTTQEGFPSGVSAGEQIFIADFFMGWPTIEETGSHIQLENGKYRFEVGPYNAKFLYTTVVDHADIYTSIEATLVECPSRGGFGLMYRFVDSSNYYLVTLFCDNTYSVIARINGSITGIANGNLPDGIKLTADQTYTLGVMAQKETFTIYLNGQSITTFSDNRIKQGDVALYAASQGDQVTRILFDNLKVWAVR